MVILDDVRVGDVLDASFTVESTPRLLPERSWLLQNVPTHLPLRAFRIAVRFAAGDLERMQWKGSVDFGSPAVREMDGEIEWSWSLERLRPREPEPRIAPWHITWPWIQVTDCQSWATVIEGLLAAWKECFTDEELLASAREIAGAAATPVERVERALSLVQDDLRHLSLEMGLGGQVPSAPGVILQRRFGDCKDKALLVAHLLRCLGIPARPVLVNTRFAAQRRAAPAHARRFQSRGRGIRNRRATPLRGSRPSHCKAAAPLIARFSTSGCACRSAPEPPVSKSCRLHPQRISIICGKFSALTRPADRHFSA